MKRVESRLLPAGVKPMGSHSGWRAPHCEKCGDPIPDGKYHDCGEQLDLLDLLTPDQT